MRFGAGGTSTIVGGETALAPSRKSTAPTACRPHARVRAPSRPSRRRSAVPAPRRGLRGVADRGIGATGLLRRHCRVSPVSSAISRRATGRQFASAEAVASPPPPRSPVPRSIPPPRRAQSRTHEPCPRATFVPRPRHSSDKPTWQPAAPDPEAQHLESPPPAQPPRIPAPPGRQQACDGEGREGHVDWSCPPTRRIHDSAVMESPPRTWRILTRRWQGSCAPRHDQST